MDASDETADVAGLTVATSVDAPARTDRRLLGRAVESFVEMQVDLARQFDRVGRELPSNLGARAIELRSRVENRLAARPQLHVLNTTMGTNVETHFARIPLDRVVSRPGPGPWNDSYHHRLDEFAAEILDSSDESPVLFAQSGRIDMFAIEGPRGAIFGGANNGGHRLGAAIVLGLDAVYGDVTHQRFPSVRTTNDFRKAKYWTLLIDAGLVEGRVVHEPTPDDRDYLMRGDYKFHVEGTVVPWILSDMTDAIDSARAYETWFPGSLSELGLPSEIWTDYKKFAAFLDNPVGGDRSTFHQQCLNSTRDGLGDALEPGTGEFANGIGMKRRVSGIRPLPEGVRFSPVDQTNVIEVRNAAFADFTSQIYNPLTDAIAGVVTNDSCSLLTHVREAMRAHSDERPDNRLREHWLGTSEEKLTLTLAWGNLDVAVGAGCFDLSLEPSEFQNFDRHWLDYSTKTKAALSRVMTALFFERERNFKQT